jgi:hypothetical protein
MAAGAEIREYYLNDPAYGSTSKIYEWVNISSCNSAYILVWSDVDFTTVVDYAIDSNFDIVDTETTGGFGGQSTKLILYSKTRFMRLTVTLSSAPAILRSQGYFHQESVVEKTIENGGVDEVQKTDPQQEKTGFGALHVEGYTPKEQYNFNKGANGTVLTFETMYNSVYGYDSLTNAAVSFADGKIILSGFSAVETAFIYGSPTKYSPAQTTMTRFTGKYFQGAKDVGGTCTIQLVGAGNTDAGNLVNGVFFGYGDDSLPYDQDSFGIMHVRDGVRTFVPRTSWNGDKADGTFSTLNITDWNTLGVFSIDFQYLGAGNMRFFIEDRQKGTFTLVHTLKFASTLVNSSFTDPSVGLMIYQEITANSLPLTTTDSVSMASFALFAEGSVISKHERGASFSQKTGVSAAENILSIRCDPTHFGSVNLNDIQIDMLTCSSDGTKGAAVCCFISSNPAILTAPSWSVVNSKIPVSRDKVGIWNPGVGEQLVAVFVLAKVDSQIVYLKDLDVRLLPGEIFVAMAQSTSSTDISVGIGFNSG